MIKKILLAAIITLTATAFAQNRPGPDCFSAKADFKPCTMDNDNHYDNSRTAYNDRQAESDRQNAADVQKAVEDYKEKVRREEERHQEQLEQMQRGR